MQNFQKIHLITLFTFLLLIGSASANIDWRQMATCNATGTSTSVSCSTNQVIPDRVPPYVSYPYWQIPYECKSPISITGSSIGYTCAGGIVGNITGRVFVNGVQVTASGQSPALCDGNFHAFGISTASISESHVGQLAYLRADFDRESGSGAIFVNIVGDLRCSRNSTEMLVNGDFETGGRYGFALFDAYVIMYAGSFPVCFGGYCVGNAVSGAGINCLHQENLHVSNGGIYNLTFKSLDTPCGNDASYLDFDDGTRLTLTSANSGSLGGGWHFSTYQINMTQQIGKRVDVLTCNNHCFPTSIIKQDDVSFFGITSTCTCGDYANVGCGLVGCNSDEMYQVRICSPTGCDSLTQCVYNSTCALVPTTTTTTGSTTTTLTPPPTTIPEGCKNICAFGQNPDCSCISPTIEWSGNDIPSILGDVLTGILAFFTPVLPWLLLLGLISAFVIFIVALMKKVI